MAEYYGSNYTKNFVNVPATLSNPGEQKAKIHFAYDEYVAAGALALNDTIKMMKLPKKARVIDVVLASSDLGTVGTLDVGWEANGTESADDNGFLNAVDVNAAAQTISMQEQNYMPGQFVQFSAETQIAIKVSAATDAAGTIKLGVYYVVD